MNVVIYNGDLKPTTFVLRLAQVVNEEHKVSFFGTSPKQFKYKDKGILFVPTDSKNKLVLLLQVVLRLISFCCIYPEKCIHFVSLLRASNKPIRTRLKQFLLWSKFVSSKVDVVHIQWASHISLFEEILDASYFKIVVSLRGSLINIVPLVDLNFKDLYLRTFPKVDKFHAVSNDIKKQAILYGAAEEKIKVIYSGVKVNSFEQFKKTDYSKSVTLKILSVGRQHWNKGYNYALEALKIVLENNIKASYTIIGAEDSEEVKGTINDLNIKDYVRLTSKMDYKDVLKEMQNADVLVLPSVSEGLANVVIEAMALGLPVISTNAVGMPELVIHKKTGLLYNNRDVNDLAEKIMNFNTMPQKNIERMSAMALQKVEEQHSWKAFKDGFMDLLQTAYNQGHVNNVSHNIVVSSENGTSLNKSLNDKTENKKLQIVTIAKLNWIEGLDHALNAMKILKDENLNFEYHIIGSGTPNEIERYTFQIHQNQLQAQVFLHLKSSNGNVYSKLGLADIYLQPNIKERGYNSVLQSQALGLLCVVTDTETLNEIVVHEKTGWVIPKREPKLLAKKIIEINDLSEREKDSISKNAINSAVNRTNVNVNVF